MNMDAGLTSWRFFDRNSDQLVRCGDVERALVEHLGPLVQGLAAANLIPRAEGCLRMTNVTSGAVLAEVSFDESFGRPERFVQIVEAEERALLLAGGAGFVSRQIRGVTTSLLTDRSPASYGSYLQDGVLAIYAGVQPFWNEKIALMAWALRAGLVDAAAHQIERVMAAMRLDCYRDAMHHLERVAELCDCATLAAAADLIEAASLRVGPPTDLDDFGLDEDVSAEEILGLARS